MVYVKIYNKDNPSMMFVYTRRIQDHFYRLAIWTPLGVQYLGPRECRETLAVTMKRARNSGLCVDVFHYNEFDGGRGVIILPGI